MAASGIKRFAGARYHRSLVAAAARSRAIACRGRQSHIALTAAKDAPRGPGRLLAPPSPAPRVGVLGSSVPSRQPLIEHHGRLRVPTGRPMGGGPRRAPGRRCVDAGRTPGYPPSIPGRPPPARGHRYMHPPLPRGLALAPPRPRPGAVAGRSLPLEGRHPETLPDVHCELAASGDVGSRCRPGKIVAT